MSDETCETALELAIVALAPRDLLEQLLQGAHRP
jgi:hypothetical protein